MSRGRNLRFENGHDPEPKKIDFWDLVRVLPLWSAEELERLAAQVAYQLERRRAFDAAQHDRTVVATRYVHEKVRCGKEGCRCERGEMHGPYWYAIEVFGDGRTRRRYIGKHLEKETHGRDEQAGRERLRDHRGDGRANGRKGTVDRARGGLEKP
jgi:hypothetical protein